MTLERGAKRVAMLGYGTRGDIQPLVVLGHELARRGHSVVLTVNSNLVEWAGRTGLEIVPIEPDLDAFMKSDEGQAALANGGLTMFSRTLAGRERAANRQITRACLRCCQGADLVLSTIMTAFRASAIVEKTGAAHGVISTMPVQPTRLHAQILAPVRQLGLGLLNRLSFDAVMALWWRNFASSQAESRAMLGLPPSSRRPSVENLPSVGVYSEALAPRPHDWAPQHHVTGFTTLSGALREQLGEAEPPQSLERWLDAGEPPVYVGFGSLPVGNTVALREQISDVAARRGLRVLIGAGWSDYGDLAKLPEHVYVTKAFDHDRILPRCRAAVHHGGAGTTAAALRAGLPTLVTSVFADQPYWGYRVTASGVGMTMPYRRLDAATFDRALDCLLDSAVTRRARALGRVLRAEDGGKAAADVIDQWLEGRFCAARPRRATNVMAAAAESGSAPCVPT